MHYSTSPLDVLGHLLNTRFRELDSFIEHAARRHGDLPGYRVGPLAGEPGAVRGVVIPATNSVIC